MKRFKKSKDIKVGLVGGGFGGYHLGQVAPAGMTLVAACDLKRDVLAGISQKYPGIETYTSLATMLRKSDIDLVILVTPHNTHCRLAVQCLNAGKHVVVDKPMAITVDECDKMLAAAKKNKRMLAVHHNRHWDGCAVQMAKVVKKQKAIGDVVRIEAHMTGYGCPGNTWRCSKSISGGVLYDWGVHVIEYCLQLVDSEVTEVVGFAHEGFWAKKCPWKKDTNEDDATAIARFKNGQWLMLTMSGVDSDPKHTQRGVVHVTGTKGAYVMDFGGWRLITHEDGKKVVTSGGNPKDNWLAFYKNVAAHLVKGTPLVVSPRDARRAICILDYAGRSARKGAAIKVKGC